MRERRSWRHSTVRDRHSKRDERRERNKTIRDYCVCGVVVATVGCSAPGPQIDYGGREGERAHGVVQGLLSQQGAVVDYVSTDRYPRR